MADQLTYSSRAAAIRETVKWIAVVFTGAGAVLFSGLSFTNLTSLASSSSWYLLIPLSVVPVVAAVWVVREATRIITYQPPDVGTILPRFAGTVLGRQVADDAELRRKLEDALPATVATYGGVAQYEQRLLSAHEAVGRAATALEQQDNLARREDLERAYSKIDQLQVGVQDLVSCGDYLGVSIEYDKRKYRFVVAGTVAVAGLVGVAYIHSSQGVQKAATTTSAAVTAPLSVKVYLPGTTDYAVVGPDHCPIWDGRSAIATGGSLAEPLLTFDGALPDLVKHPLAVDVRHRCSKPWVWDAKGARLVVLPAAVSMNEAGVKVR